MAGWQQSYPSRIRSDLESAEVVSRLKKLGIKKVVMMTGDSDRTAKAIAEQVGVDEYYSEVLPEDKAKFVEAEKTAGPQGHHGGRWNQ